MDSVASSQPTKSSVAEKNTLEARVADEKVADEKAITYCGIYKPIMKSSIKWASFGFLAAASLGGVLAVAENYFTYYSDSTATEEDRLASLEVSMKYSVGTCAVGGSFAGACYGGLKHLYKKGQDLQILYKPQGLEPESTTQTVKTPSTARAEWQEIV